MASFAQKWIANSSSNYGLIIKQNNETKTECEANPANCNRRYVAFNSSAVSESATRPKTLTPFPAAEPAVSPGRLSML